MIQDLARYLHESIDGATALETLESCETIGNGIWHTTLPSGAYRDMGLAWSAYRSGDYLESYQLAAPVLRLLQNMAAR